MGRDSQLLQPAVQVALAALPGPGTALQAKESQVLLEVFMDHGSVSLRLTLGLQHEDRRASVKLRNRTKKKKLYLRLRVNEQKVRTKTDRNSATRAQKRSGVIVGRCQH